MTRIFSQQPTRKLFPIAALAISAFVLAATPVSVGPSGLSLHQAYAQGDADHGADKGGAEGSGADRGGSADRGSADTGSGDRGSNGAAGTNGSADSASHDANDR